MWLVQHCARDILEALTFLHREGYVHADLKPRNILWSADDECFKLIDFGLSFKQGNQVGSYVGNGTWAGRRLGSFKFSLPLSGCEVRPDRRVPSPGGGAPEQSGPGRDGGRLWLHGCHRPLEPGRHPAGDVLWNQAEGHGPLPGVEGTAAEPNSTRCVDNPDQISPPLFLPCRTTASPSSTTSLRVTAPRAPPSQFTTSETLLKGKPGLLAAASVLPYRLQ